jgi:hypothetical protein
MKTLTKNSTSTSKTTKHGIHLLECPEGGADVLRVGPACIAETRPDATLQLPTETPALKTSVANLQRGESRRQDIDDESYNNINYYDEISL